jgi:hypothetical protein
MQAAFGDLDLTYDAATKTWSGQAGKSTMTDGTWYGGIGSGRVILSPAPLGEQKRPEVVMAALSEAIPVQPVSTDMADVELLLRRNAGGTNYVFAINLSAREPQAGAIRVAGHPHRVRELSVEGRPQVAVTPQGNVTDIPMQLGPGQCLCFELRGEG